MNWKNLVEKKNAKTYVLPPGWDSRDKVAEDLECSPEKVRDHLRPALKSGEVIEQQFKVWNSELKRLMFVTAYREAEIEPKKLDVPAMAESKKSGETWAQIGKQYGISPDRARALVRRYRP